MNLQASVLKTENICKGSEKVISIPSNFILFPLEYYYGVSTNGGCDAK